MFAVSQFSGRISGQKRFGVKGQVIKHSFDSIEVAIRILLFEFLF